MSCMFTAPSCGDEEDLPLSDNAITELKRAGLEAIKDLIRYEPEQLTPPAQQYTGASLRPDGRMFYLTTVAPKAKEAEEAEWTGAFYAPFGFFHVCGWVKAGREDATTSSVSVTAKLIHGQKDLISASWTVIGPQASVRTPNRACLIKSIEISASGPHDERDIRACIARHAPERALGVPKAIVALQCGVAVACLIEAIC